MIASWAGGCLGVAGAAAVLLAQQFGAAKVEFVVANRGKIKPCAVQHADRRLIKIDR